jgi:bacterioferritin-associated ferredoxin
MRSSHTLRTNLNCGSCIAKAKPFLDSLPAIESWRVDTTDPGKPLSVVGQNLTADQIRAAVRQSGFEAFEEIAATPALATAARPWYSTYRPILLIFLYLLAATALIEVNSDAFDSARAMSHFMGGFFLTFSFFKLLNLSQFADAYATYDLLARRSRAYALTYPFLELGLGLSYLVQAWPMATHGFALALMSVSSLGVIQSLWQRRLVECACLGTVFNLPMSKITLFEDLLMAFMAGAMLIQ